MWNKVLIASHGSKVTNQVKSCLEDDYKALEYNYWEICYMNGFPKVNIKC